MARSHKLEHFTKGTGATVVRNAPAEAAPEEKLNTVPLPPRRGAAPRRAPARKTALPPGHVRKKATGEIGRVETLDSRAGTVTVLWLRQGRRSTVPLSSVARR